MTPEEIQDRVHSIRFLVENPAGAHEAEDDLHRDVLTAIANGAANPAALAREAIKTSEIWYQRWYE